mgnify:CR=1 FL=1
MIHGCGCITKRYPEGVFIKPCKKHKGREVWIVLKHKEKKGEIKNESN